MKMYKNLRLAIYLLLLLTGALILNVTGSVQGPESLIDKITGQYVKAAEADGKNRAASAEMGNSTETNSPLIHTREKIGIARQLYKEDKYTKALNVTNDAYLEGFEKIEKELSVKDSELTEEIEHKLHDFRTGIQNRISYNELSNIKQEIISGLDKASDLLNDKSSVSSVVLFTNSFSILLREVVEAVLIIAAIMAYMSRTGAGAQIKYIHFGWVSAVIAGLLTWFLASTVIQLSGASREVIEGVTALAAAAVLFYVSYWLITKIEIEKWKEFLKNKVQNALNRRSLVALAGVSFLAVYREAFETVLFYQALLFQAEGSVSPVLWGLVAAIILALIIVYAVFRLTLRIPLRYFFSFTSIFLYILCFIMIGKGVHELQEAGVVDTHSLNIMPSVDFLGIYPTIETLVPQGIIMAALLLALFWIFYVTKLRESESQQF